MSSQNYQLLVPDDISHLIKKLHPQIKAKIRSALDFLMNDPYQGKPLKKELIGLWSFKLGRLRVIYRIKAKVLEIIAIGPRKTIYVETYQRLGSE